MTVFLATNRLFSFIFADGSATETTSNTGGSSFNASEVQSAIQLPSPSTTDQSVQLIRDIGSNENEVWGRFYFNPNASVFRPGNNLITFTNGSGVNVFRVRGLASSPVVTVQYWNGSSWVSDFTFSAPNALSLYEFQLICGASGEFRVWVNGTLQGTLTGLNAAVNHVRKVAFGGPAQTSSQRLSAFALTDFDLRGMVVTSNVPTGDGFYTAGTGTFADVDDIPVTVSSVRVLPSVGNKSSMTKAPRTFPGGFQIEAVAINASARVAGGVVNNFRGLLRIASTDYTGPDVSLQRGYLPSSAIWELSPATGVLFTTSEFNSLQFGAEARA